jgi:hypothetical protein
MTPEQKLLMFACRRLIDVARNCFQNLAVPDADGKGYAPWDRRNAELFTLEVFENMAYITGIAFPVSVKIDNLNKRIEFTSGGFQELIILANHATVIAQMRGFVFQKV